jgi:hypothetical protein
LAGVRKRIVEQAKRNSKRYLMVELVDWYPKSYRILDLAALQK